MCIYVCMYIQHTTKRLNKIKVNVTIVGIFLNSRFIGWTREFTVYTRVWKIIK